MAVLAMVAARRLRLCKHLASASKQQAGNSLLDVWVAKDLRRNLAEDAVMHVWLGSKLLELLLLF